MKKFALAAAALATVFSTSAMAAPNPKGHDARGSQVRAEQRHDDRARNPAPKARVQKVSQRSWQKGDRFDSRRAPNYRVISQPRAYGLKAPPSGHRYVQSGNDAILVGITSGVVAAIFANVIR